MGRRTVNSQKDTGESPPEAETGGSGHLLQLLSVFDHG
jgi:hypothetical protein